MDKKGQKDNNGRQSITQENVRLNNTNPINSGAPEVQIIAAQSC